MWPRFDLQRSSKVKDILINWEFIYYFPYVFQVNFGHNMLQTQWLWFVLTMSSNVKCLNVNWYVIYDFVYHMIHCLWDTSFYDLYLNFKCHQRLRPWGKLQDNLWLHICSTQRFRDISRNSYQRYKSDLCYIESDLQSISAPLIFDNSIRITHKEAI